MTRKVGRKRRGGVSSRRDQHRKRKKINLPQKRKNQHRSWRNSRIRFRESFPHHHSGESRTLRGERGKGSSIVEKVLFPPRRHGRTYYNGSKPYLKFPVRRQGEYRRNALKGETSISDKLKQRPRLRQIIEGGGEGVMDVIGIEGGRIFRRNRLGRK